MRKVIIISAKNPTETLLHNINNCKIYYNDFKIIIIDSNSNEMRIYKIIEENFKDIIIDYAKNVNYELGAWKYAINKYDYDLYFFIQDTLIPTRRIDDLNNINNFNNIIYNCPYVCQIGVSGSEMNFDDLKRLRDIYRNTKFSFISELHHETYINGSSHTSFLANKEISKKIIELEDVYEEKMILKKKIDSHLSERTVGIIIDCLGIEKKSMKDYFHKINGGRI